MRISAALLMFSVVGLLTAAPVWAVMIDFEAGAPCAFSEVSGPLTTLYSAQGVTFSGPNATDGGAILNECGMFGVNALSGTDFLAFNSAGLMRNGGIAIDPEMLSFSTAVSHVSIFFGHSITIRMEAFDAFDNLVASDTQTAASGSYAQLSVSGSAITKVTLTRMSGNSLWVFDDLSFTPAPEPVPVPAIQPTCLIAVASLLLSLGLAGIAAGRRN